MTVSREDVLRVAALARLEVSDEEAEGLRRELEDILGHVEMLPDVEDRASGVEHPSPVAPARADEPGADTLSGVPGAFAPAFRGGFFRVPRLASHEDGGAGE